MTVRIKASGAAAGRHQAASFRSLVNDLVASRIADFDDSLWGPDAETEAAKRLGWTEAVAISRPLVSEIYELRDLLHRTASTTSSSAGMGGSSLAPEVITRTYGVALTVLDSTEPGQVLHALNDRLATSALVVSSKSGSTVETDSQKRLYEKAFTRRRHRPDSRASSS